MRKIINILLFATIFAVNSLAAESADAVLAKTMALLNSKTGLNANYTVTTSQGSSSGEILIKGNKFRILSNDVKCWFDGKKQWSYSPAVGEVNITAPTEEELATVNPFAITKNFKQNFKASFAKSASQTTHTIVLTAKTKNQDIKQATLSIDKKTYRITKAVLVSQSGEKVTFSMSNYKNMSCTDASFVFNKKLVPAGTPVIDLQ